MTAPSTLSPQPDWGRIAEKFDAWLPHIAPVGEALLSALEVQPGHQVLDLASGTGEPALTLARRLGGQVEIIGTDAAPGMVQAARHKATREALPVTFEVMPIEALTFDAARFDRVSCRFGLMFCADPAQGLREIRRVLKPGGRFALAVWGQPERMTTLYWTYQVLRNLMPPEHLPPLMVATSLGAPGVLEVALAEAGFSDFHVTDMTLEYCFPSFAAYWEVVLASEILKPQLDRLSSQQYAAVCAELEALAAPFHEARGLVMPHQYLLASGRK